MNWRSLGRAAATRFALLLFGGLLALLLAELTLRVTGNTNPPLWAPDPVLGWLPVPGAETTQSEGDYTGHVRINSHGFRDRERELERTSETLRIAVFGDSMTEADQVDLDQTFCFLLEEALGKRGESAEVFNLAVTGYSPTQELLLMRRWLPILEPDLILVMLFLDNDVSGSHPRLTVNPGTAPFLAEVDGTPTFDFSESQQSFDDYHREPKHTIRKWSALYRLIYRAKKDLLARRQLGAGEQEDVPRRFELYLESPPAIWEEAWRRFELAVQSMVDEAGAHGVPIALVSVPAAQWVDPKIWRGIVDGNEAMKSARWHLRGPEQRLETLASALNVTLIAPRPAFERAAHEASLFIGEVGHLTPDGHRVMATELLHHVEHALGLSDP